jgi:uncharacterized protein YbjQ (UPF0145 family)
MLITTMNDVPGHVVDEVYGKVFGLTVRSRNVGSQIGASLKVSSPTSSSRNVET